MSRFCKGDLLVHAYCSKTSKWFEGFGCKTDGETGKVGEATRKDAVRIVVGEGKTHSYLNWEAGGRSSMKAKAHPAS